MNVHPGELTLRRLFAGESLPSRAHVDGCAECQHALTRFGEEQARFEAEIPFERFAAGVERAQRTPRVMPAPNQFRRVFAIAAGVALIAAVAGVATRPGGNRVKGGTELEVKIAGADGSQRSAAALETLKPGERVRFGVVHRGAANVVALSIDEAGEVSTIYSGAHIEGTGQSEYLPDSLEFTGHGKERVVVLVSAQPLDVQQLSQQLQTRFTEAKRTLDAMQPLSTDAEQFQRVFVKP